MLLEAEMQFLALLLGLESTVPIYLISRAAFSHAKTPYAGFLSIYVPRVQVPSALQSFSLCSSAFPLMPETGRSQGKRLILLWQMWWAWLNGHPLGCPPRNPHHQKHRPSPSSQEPWPQLWGPLSLFFVSFTKQLCI